MVHGSKGSSDRRLFDVAVIAICFYIYALRSIGTDIYGLRSSIGGRDEVSRRKLANAAKLVGASYGVAYTQFAAGRRRFVVKD